MEAIFGRTFRSTQVLQPLWLRVLLFALSAGLMLLTVVFFYNMSRSIWGIFRTVGPLQRALVGEVFAFGIGYFVLALSYGQWRKALFLDPPMRDLAMTPGRPMQLLRIALRWRWVGGDLGNLVLLCVMTHPWLWLELLQFGRAINSTFVMAWAWPLSIPLAIIMALLFYVLHQALGIALALAGAALGLGGVMPRWRFVARILPYLNIFVILAVAVCVGSLLLELLCASPADAMWFVDIGRALRPALSPESGGWARTLFGWFPTVLWFDCFYTMMNDPDGVFSASLLRCVLWLGAAALAGAACLRAAFSPAVRSCWHADGAGARPADASKTPRQKFDPDAVSGTCEAWYLRRFGRMGRAALRLATLNFESGSIDVHLRRVLVSVPLSLAGAWLCMRLAPPAVNAVCLIFGSPLGASARQTVAAVVAVLWIVGLLFYRLDIFTGMSTALGQLRYMENPARGAGNFFSTQRSAFLTLTRGDNRYPMTEIYATGFSDTVLIPFLSIGAWLFLLAALAFFEATLLGLSGRALNWTTAIALPIAVQGYFISRLNSVTRYWKDYRRSHLISFVIGMLSVFVVLFLLTGLAVLMLLLVTTTVEQNHPWIGWLGCMNMLVVFDIAAYRLARWLYVRRRFDAENRYMR